LVLWGSLALRGQEAILERLDNKVQPARWDQLDRQARLEHQDSLDLKDLPAAKDKKGRKESQEHWVLLVL